MAANWGQGRKNQLLRQTELADFGRMQIVFMRRWKIASPKRLTSMGKKLADLIARRAQSFDYDTDHHIQICRGYVSYKSAANIQVKKTR